MIVWVVATAFAQDCDVVQERVAALDVAIGCPTAALRSVQAAVLARPECAPLAPWAVRPAPPRPRGSTAEKTVRDSWATFPNERTSENFALKWGVDATVSEESVAWLLASLEASWALEVGEYGYVPPAGTDVYKMNVYLGDSGSGAPSSLGAAGYYWTDDDGYPMLVVGKDGLGDREYTELTVAHELFHALQDATGDYEYDDRSGWWWESTAVWMEHEVYPTNDAWPLFLYFFAVRPELWIGHFEYPETGRAEEYHQYGAFVFVSHLTERHGGPELVHDSFVRSAEGTPLGVIETLVEEAGSSLDATWSDFTVRNATWDYPHEDWFRAWIDVYEGSVVSHRPSGRIAGVTAGWVEAPAPLPRTYGAHYWELGAVRPAFTLSFDGDFGARWNVAVVGRSGDVRDVRTLTPNAEGEGTLDVRDLDAVDEAWIVITPMVRLVDRGDEYAYHLQIAEIPVEPPVVEEPKACGCATGAGGGGWVGATALAAALGARRRSRR